jgi:hypothetical protein
MCRRSTLATAYLDAYFVPLLFGVPLQYNELTFLQGLELAVKSPYMWREFPRNDISLFRMPRPTSTQFLEPTWHVTHVAINVPSALIDLQHHGSYTPWMRRSTGHLCVDLSPSTTHRPILPAILPAGVPHVTIPPLPRDQDAAVIDALTLRQHQEIINHSYSISRWSSESQFVKKQMDLGALIYRHPLSEDPVGLAAITTGRYEDSGWKLRVRGSLIPSNPMRMRNGWTR